MSEQKQGHVTGIDPTQISDAVLLLNYGIANGWYDEQTTAAIKTLCQRNRTVEDVLTQTHEVVGKLGRIL